MRTTSVSDYLCGVSSRWTAVIEGATSTRQFQFSLPWESVGVVRPIGDFVLAWSVAVMVRCPQPRKQLPGASWRGAWQVVYYGTQQAVRVSVSARAEFLALVGFPRVLRLERSLEQFPPQLLQEFPQFLREFLQFLRQLFEFLRSFI